jgi:hypothetical protein
VKEVAIFRGHGKTIHPDFIMAPSEMIEAEFTAFLARVILKSLAYGAVLFLLD